MNSAPKTTPTSEPSPPTTTPISSRSDRLIWNVSGFTKPMMIAYSDPATPAKNAEIPNASVFVSARLIPDETAAISDSRIVRNARPSFP
jgi:hypothetical protein